MRPLQINFDIDNAAAAGICSAKASSGASLTLDGTLTSGGAYASIDKLAHKILIKDTSSKDQSGATFTIVGTDADGYTQTNAIAGPASGATVNSTKYFKSITSISIANPVSAATVDVGTIGNVASRTYAAPNSEHEPVVIQADVTGTVNFTIQDTLQDPYDRSLPAPFTFVDQEDLAWIADANFTSQSADMLAHLAQAGVRAFRIVTNSYSSGAEIQFYATFPRNEVISTVKLGDAVLTSDISTATYDFVIDEDNMVSNTDTKVPTQQSVKAYVDTVPAPRASPTFTGDVTLATTDLGLSGFYATPLITKLADASGHTGILRSVNDGGDIFYSDLFSAYFAADSATAGGNPEVLISADGIAVTKGKPISIDYVFADALTGPQFSVADGGGLGHTGFMIDTYNGTCWLNNGTNIAISSQTSDTNATNNFAEVQISYSGIFLKHNAAMLMYAYSEPANVPTSTLVYQLDGTGIVMQGGGKIVLDKATSAETSNAVTINAQAGVITTSALTTAGGSSYLVTLTNSKIIGTGSIIMTSVAGGTNTTKNFKVESKCTAANTATLTIYNNTAATALNGTVIINFVIV